MESIEKIAGAIDEEDKAEVTTEKQDLSSISQIESGLMALQNQLTEITIALGALKISEESEVTEEVTEEGPEDKEIETEEKEDE